MKLRHLLSLSPLIALCSGALPGELATQGEPPATRMAAATSVLRASCGLAWQDDAWIAAGPRYRARFDAAGMRFEPALGRSAPRTRGVSFAFEFASLGGSSWTAQADGALPARHGSELHYGRAMGVTEIYAVGASGVKQSFRFDTLPKVHGELVVRGRLSTDLELPATDWHGETLELRDGQHGGVRIGAVLGIDADGDCAPGSLSLVDGVLELRLPAAFVAAADLPLVLDPLFGPLTSLAPNENAQDIDVAYDATQDRYLFAWEQWSSNTDADIHGQLVSGAGALVGAMKFYEAGITPIATNPTVANVNSADAFLVAWQQSTSGALGPYAIVARGQPADDSGFTATTTLTTGGNCLEPDAGGEATLSDDDVLVVYRREGEGIHSLQVTMNGVAVPFLVNETVVMATAYGAKPAISKSGGSSGRYAVVFERTPPANTLRDVYIAGLDRNNVLLSAAAPLATTANADEQDPDVDGDGTQFLVVYEREASLGSGDNDVHARKLAYVGNALVPQGAELAIDADEKDDEVDPCVAYASNRYLVAWADEDNSAQGGALQYDILYLGLDPTSLVVCELETFVSGSQVWGLSPEMAARRSASTNALEDRVALAWTELDIGLPFEGDVKFQQLEGIGAGGPIVSLGGGCGQPGNISIQGPLAVGNASLDVRLALQHPATLVILNVALPAATLSCGTCTWAPFQITFIAPVGGLEAHKFLPVPCDAALNGVVLDFQWTEFPVPATECPLFPNIAVTHILRGTIGL